MTQPNPISPHARSPHALSHFTAEEEAALHSDRSTNEIVRDKIHVDITGDDRPYDAVVDHQHTHVGVIGSLELTHVLVHGAEMAGVIEFGSGLPPAVFALISAGTGVASYLEMHESAAELRDTLPRDQAHAALLSVLTLPEDYKTSRLAGPLHNAPLANGTEGFKMTEKLRADPKAVAVLQLHADRGMNAARDVGQSGLSRAAFFAQHPRTAEAYARDAAFREGFDAYVHVQTFSGPATLGALERQLEERNAWYAQSEVRVRG